MATTAPGGGPPAAVDADAMEVDPPRVSADEKVSCAALHASPPASLHTRLGRGHGWTGPLRCLAG